MLDTNLWSDLADDGTAADFYDMARREPASVVIPPSVLLELLRNPNSEVRERHVNALFAGPRIQLRSEAQMESGEIIAEVRRLHPEWLRRFPDTARVASLESFWTKRIWRMARETSESLSVLARSHVHTRKGEAVLHNQKRNRAALRESGADFSKLDILLEWLDAPDWYRAVIPAGKRVEKWRFDCLTLFWNELHTVARRSAITKEAATYADWTGAHVDLAKMTADPTKFAYFWLKEVELAAMRRRWLRTAGDVAQTMSKITGGNPYDNQHIAYLPDCDLFLTADRRFADCLSLVASAAPFETCTTHLVKHQPGSTIEEIDRVTRQTLS